MDEPLFQVESTDESSGFLLWQMSNLWQRKIREGLEPLDLTHVQFVLLACTAWLEAHQTCVTQVQLAKQAKTDVMMTSKVLRTLEGKGFIERQPHPTDTRAKVLTVTAVGRELLFRAIRVVDGIDHAFFSVLGEQVPLFNAALIQILAAHQE